MSFLLMPLAGLLCISLTLGNCFHKKKHRKYHERSVKHSQPDKPVRTGATVISGNESGILVTATWMKKYRALEQKHGGVPADDWISREGDQYRIPFESANHFNEMVRER